eukprot:SAG31_NODE_2025_length_6642_cov_6.408681_4_plen_31_part_00
MFPNYRNKLMLGEVDTWVRLKTSAVLSIWF